MKFILKHHQAQIFYVGHSIKETVIAGLPRKIVTLETTDRLEKAPRFELEEVTEIYNKYPMREFACHLVKEPNEKR